MANATEQLGLWNERGEPARGATYEPAFDRERLVGQMERVYDVMSDGLWRTLSELRDEIARRYPDTHDSESGIAARLRCLRRAEFGGHIVESRRVGDATRGAWEYRLRLEGQSRCA